MGSSSSVQKIAGYGVAAIAAVFVLYPVYFLLQAAFDVGDPQIRPPTAYGVDNFSGLLQYPQIMLKLRFWQSPVRPRNPVKSATHKATGPLWRWAVNRGEFCMSLRVAGRLERSTWIRGCAGKANVSTLNPWNVERMGY